MAFDLVIKGGTLITPYTTRNADLGIVGECIGEIGTDLKGDETINATGKLVLPGAIDPHVHLQMPAGATQSSDDWQSGTIAAAQGGTTTILDFVEPSQGESLIAALETRRAQAHGKAVIDYGLHMTLRNDDPSTLAEIPDVVSAGITSFKTYMTYEGLRLDDAALLRSMASVRNSGGIVMVHAENDAAIDYLRTRFVSEKRTAPRFHAFSRPATVEVEAVHRALSLAEIVRCSLYVVHVSTERGGKAIARARLRGQPVFGETCPQYLLLTDAEYERPGFEGAKFVCSPPLRSPENAATLWRLLADGVLQTVGTDHCPFYFVGQKDLGRDSFVKIPSGIPGIELRLALLYSFGVLEDKLSMNRWVQACCTAPAKIFGLYPRKGSLQSGADADMVIFDPHKNVTISRAILHENVDYTPYDGLALRGYPTMTISRGEVICKAGRFVGRKGRGRYISRPSSTSPL